MDSQPQLQTGRERSPGHSPFFTLPLELRVNIYGMIFQDSASRVSLLPTNRQVFSESRALLYSQPATFDSQNALFAWLSRSEPALLSRVQRISLTIDDLDLSGLIGSRDDARPSVWSMYTDELHRLGDAFGNLPSLLHLTILQPDGSRSLLFDDFHRRVLALLPTRVPTACSISSLAASPAAVRTERDSSAARGKAAAAVAAAGRESPRDRTSYSDSVLAESKELLALQSIFDEHRPCASRWQSDPSGLRKRASKQEQDWLGDLQHVFAQQPSEPV
ncbi:hypothetical protein MBLNU459_g5662t1 [Dothideomycetes sp. NU459]